ncbi:unnamed protein product [Dovyalis caffra]|uniref:Pectinesterase inhibitor domain-containing protein n=1 Tax=Dovyalis caffra TaxID=77055 RepID=A0AAV1SLV1_9ROSI|nr:unnamed protein product [Dovyalis caffra]
MASSKIFLTMLALFFLMISSAFSVTSIRLQFATKDGVQDLISTTCNHTLHFEMCVSALRSDPRSQKSDLLGLANIALNISIAHGSETLAQVSDLKSYANNDTQLPVILSECIEEYTEATENLKEAIHALKVRSFDDMNTLVSTAMTDSDTCEQGFKEMNKASLLTDRNESFSKLCSIFLSITTLLS